MKLSIKKLLMFFCFVLMGIYAQALSVQANSTTAKPWTYWWIMGSSMNKADIDFQLEYMAKSNIGGVHIIPIYGEKGDEANYIEFLSEKWIDYLDYISKKASSLNMGVDMTLGTGWPFGGKYVSEKDAAKKIDKNFKIVPTKQKVKRAAYGGEGFVIDPFSKTAFENYTKAFDKAFAKYSKSKMPIRAIYNDSYEIYGADFTDNFYEDFKRLRGYDFKAYQEKVLFNDNKSEGEKRIIQDYLHTLSDLLYEGMTKGFADYGEKLNVLTRNQAHGSPANIIDLYALCSIPETESFGSSAFDINLVRVDEDYEPERFGRPNILMMKFASSASNVEGKILTSSETGTWLANHFKVALSQVKPQVDELFVSGINHIFWHGSSYSPKDKPFPGRIFYASTNFNFNSHFGEYFGLLNKYIENCQSILQNSKSTNKILVYFPVHTFWKDNFLQFDVHHCENWLCKNEYFRDAITSLLKKGYQFDYVSDRQLINNKNLLKNYDILLVAYSDEMPLQTLKAIGQLADSGLKIAFQNKVPSNVSGFYNYEANSVLLQSEAEKITKNKNVKEGNIFDMLESFGAVCESSLAENSLNFIKKTQGQDKLYFISNLNSKFGRGKICLNDKAKFVEYYNPLGNVRGFLNFENKDNKVCFNLELLSGQSCFIFLRDKKDESLKEIAFKDEVREIDFPNNYEFEFLQGLPKAKGKCVGTTFESWTNFDIKDSQYFSGVGCYRLKFNIEDNTKDYLIELGDVRECANVKINGVHIAYLWSVPFRTFIPENILKNGENLLEIEVRNLSFNRVIHLDKQKVKWRNFKDINFVDITYNPKDYSNANPVQSGLLTKPKIIELKLELK